MILTIRFARSPSAYFALAQSLAAAHPSYKETKVGTQTIYEVTLGDEDVELIEELAKMVGNWKSTKITANGVRVRHWDIELALFCQDNYECTAAKHWCVACQKYRDLKENEKQVAAAVNFGDYGNVIGLPLSIPGGPPPRKWKPKRRPRKKK